MCLPRPRWLRRAHSRVEVNTARRAKKTARESDAWNVVMTSGCTPVPCTSVHRDWQATLRHCIAMPPWIFVIEGTRRIYVTSPSGLWRQQALNRSLSVISRAACAHQPLGCLAPAATRPRRPNAGGRCAGTASCRRRGRRCSGGEKTARKGNCCIAVLARKAGMLLLQVIPRIPEIAIKNVRGELLQFKSHEVETLRDWRARRELSNAPSHVWRRPGVERQRRSKVWQPGGGSRPPSPPRRSTPAARRNALKLCRQARHDKCALPRRAAATAAASVDRDRL